MAKLTLNGVTITKLTLDGVLVTKLNLGGVLAYSAATQYTNLHTNTALAGGADNTAPTDMINVNSGDTTMVALGGGLFSFQFNPDGASDQRQWEYRVENGGANGVALVNGSQYRYEVDTTLVIATDGDVGLDATRGGLAGITIDSTVKSLILGTKVTESVTFTVNNATHLIRFRHGVGHGAAATGSVTMENARLLDLGAPVTTTYTHAMTVWHGVNSAGMDASVPGGSVSPLAAATGRSDITRITSIAGGAPIVHLAGQADFGARITLTFQGGIVMQGIGVDYNGTHTRFVGDADGDAMYNYLASKEGLSIDFDVLYEASGSYTPDPAPSGAIHTMPTVDYSTGQGAFLLHVDHTGDANDTSYVSSEFEARYDEDWSTLTNVTIESGRLKCVVDAGTYKKGIQSGGNLATNYNDLYMTYEFEFATGFDFVLGGKLPGLSGRPGMTGAHADGCNPQGQDGGFSARMMFRPDGQLEGYFYHEDQPGSCGHQINFQEAGVDFKVLTGTKYLMEIHVTMNTAGNRDGIVVVKINGIEVLRKANFRFSNSGAHGINHKFIQMWHGGNSSSWAPAVNSTFFMNHFTVSEFPLVY